MTSNQQPATSHNPEPETRNPKPDKGRTPKQIIVLGTNGTGKTTAVKKLVINELKKGSRALVVVPDDMEWPSLEYVNPRFPHRIEWYRGARKIVYFPGLIDIIRERYRDGLLIFDDCRAYFTAAIDMDLRSLLIRRRQQMIDICACGHGFTEVPPAFFTFATHYILFKTLDNINRRKNFIQNIEEMKAAQLRVNEKALKNIHYSEIINV